MPVKSQQDVPPPPTFSIQPISSCPVRLVTVARFFPFRSSGVRSPDEVSVDSLPHYFLVSVLVFVPCQKFWYVRLIYKLILFILNLRKFNENIGI